MKILSLIIFLIFFNSQAFSFWFNVFNPYSDLTEKQVVEEIKSLKAKIKERQEVYNDLAEIRYVKKNESMIDPKTFFADYAYSAKHGKDFKNTLAFGGAVFGAGAVAKDVYDINSGIKNKFLRVSSTGGITTAIGLLMILLIKAPQAYGDKIISSDFEPLYEKYKKLNKSLTEKKAKQMLNELKDPEELNKLFKQHEALLGEIKKFDSFMSIFKKSLEDDQLRLEKLEKHQASFSEL